MRHAKSSWKDKTIPDHDRSLKKKGKKDVANMAKLLKKKGLVPDHILSSTAVRAKDSAELMAEKLDYKGQIEFFEELYMAEPEVYLNFSSQVKDEVNTLLLVGHNPGLEGLAMLLSDNITSLPTGSIAKINIPIESWKQLDASTDGQIHHVWVPEDYR